MTEAKNMFLWEIFFKKSQRVKHVVKMTTAIVILKCAPLQHLCSVGPAQDNVYCIQCVLLHSL